MQEVRTHPESYPDTNACPVLDMGYAALAARTEAGSWRNLFDASRWWFTLAQCAGGKFQHPLHCDTAGYGADSRLSASAMTMFVFSLLKQSLLVTSKQRGG